MNHEHVLNELKVEFAFNSKAINLILLNCFEFLALMGFFSTKFGAICLNVVQFGI